MLCENRLMLVRPVPKLQSFEYHSHAYLGFEISAIIGYFFMSPVLALHHT